MSKGLKLGLYVLAAYLCLAVLHVRLNIGLDAFNFTGEGRAESSFRVGFLPVT